MLEAEARMYRQPLALLAAALALGGFVVFGARSFSRRAPGGFSAPGEIELPAPAPERDRAYPDELRTPGSDPARIVVRLEALDGSDVSGLRLVLDELLPGSAAAGRSHRSSACQAGRIDDVNVPAGRWRIRLDSRRFRAPALGEHVLCSGRTLDLGTLALERKPLHRGMLRDAWGWPLPGYALIEPVGRERAPADCFESVSDAHGAFELAGDMPESFELLVRTPDYDTRPGGQFFSLLRWEPEKVAELELEPFRHVVLDVHGAELLGPAYELDLAPWQPGDVPMLCAPDGRNELEPLVRARRTGVEGDALRFEVWLASGSYLLWGGELAHARQGLRLVVGEADEQVFGLEPR